MRRPSEPPPSEFFDTARPPAGPLELGLAFGGLRLALAGMDEGLRDSTIARYGSYVDPGTPGAESLRIEIRIDDQADYFIDPRPRESNPLLLACDGDRVRTLGYCAAGWFDAPGERGELVLRRGGFEPAHRSLENFVRAAVAWQAAVRGGALVHAASAVLEDRGYLFYGESGAGKSTLAACNRRARVVSDDLSLVLPGADGALELVGTPFRGTHEEGRPFVGAVRLAAGFRIVKDDHAEVRAVPRLRALAELVGNLPFVAEAYGRRPDLFAAVERAFRPVPLGHLHFRKDDTYWDAIARAGL